MNRRVAVVLFAATAAFWLVGVPGYLTVQPPYQVWKQRLLGEAELRRAESTRRILVEQAQAILGLVETRGGTENASIVVCDFSCPDC